MILASRGKSPEEPAGWGVVTSSSRFHCESDPCSGRSWSSRLDG